MSSSATSSSSSMSQLALAWIRQLFTTNGGGSNAAGRSISSSSSPSSHISQLLLPRNAAAAASFSAALLILSFYLLRRRLLATRKKLYSTLPASFFSPSKHPPYAAPSDALPPPYAVASTQLLYSLLPLRLQHAFRDSGGFRLLADVGIYAGGALLLFTHPRLLREHFISSSPENGVEWNVVYQKERQLKCDVAWRHRVAASKASTSSSSSSSSSSLVPPSPVLLFIHGGAWGSGAKDFYRLFLSPFDTVLGFVTVTISYRVYPAGNVDAQLEDVAAALEWTRENIARYGGDPDRITLAGHSSGAHITSLFILRSILNNTPPRWIGVHSFIGLSGVYDIADHYHFESARGVHRLSPMAVANGGGDPSQFTSYSPTQLAKRLTDKQREMLPPMLLLHGESDATVPYSSSIKFAYALAGEKDENTRLDLVALPNLPSHNVYHRVTSAASSTTIRAFTFTPRSSSSSSASSQLPPSLILPQIHTRIHGSATDPLQCDHASFIMDLLRATLSESSTSTTATTTATTATTLSPFTTTKQIAHLGYARWILESIREFMISTGEVDRINGLAKASVDTTKSDAHTNSQILRANL